MMVPLLCSFLADGRLSRRFLCPRGRRPHRTHGACAVHHPSVFSRRHRDLLRSRSSIVRSQRRAHPRSRRGGSPLARSLLVRSRSLPTTHSRPTVRRNARGQPERWTHGHLATRASRDCRLGPAHIAVGVRRSRRLRFSSSRAEPPVQRGRRRLLRRRPFHAARSQRHAALWAISEQLA